MAVDDESNYSSNDDADPSFLAMQAQQRLFQLKKQRDERMNMIVKESAASMEKLRARIVAYQDERRTKEYISHVVISNAHLELTSSRAVAFSASVTRIIEAVEHRRDIEQQMETLVSQVSSTTREVEEMMKTGLRGREKDAKQAR
ncbi:hypothetical protein F66182_2899 [Fusarium sp. NRRL 66182]|nr:hypothetical protein F66182_2899 [Fusarium sp. NRRL 66182]